jgi:hypothetical protein
MSRFRHLAPRLLARNCASYFAKAHCYYELYVDGLMEMCEKTPVKGHHATALQSSACAPSLIESLTEARADIRRGIDPAFLMCERSLHNN